MTQEEKAKAYDEALKKAKKELNTCGSQYCDAARQIFRLFLELTESEDERMSRELIAYFKNNSVYIKWSGLDVKKVIEWLEKQCQTFTKKDVDDAYLKGICDAKQELEKQGEQRPKAFYSTIVETGNGGVNTCVTRELSNGEKPADKVEPKFKVGDWVVHNESGFVGQITKIIKFDDGFAYDHTNGYFHGWDEDNYHLWTIQDAKDGDVVVFNNKVYLLKGIMIDDTDDIIGFTYHCDYYDDKLESGYFLQKIDIETVTPATKEQRDLLFQKMEEAGYTWSPDEKKLKKIEQKTAWSDEQIKAIESLRHKWLMGNSAEAKYRVEAYDELIEMLKEE